MPSIDISSVMKKVGEYAKSPDGIKKQKAILDKYRKEGVRKTGSGDRVITMSDMEDASSKLALAIINSARSYAGMSGSGGIPPSVMSLIETLDYTKPMEMSDGSYVVNMYFCLADRDALYRPSLSDAYDGVNNIIALFNSGYSANGYVYGYWDNHQYTGEWNTLRQNLGDNFAYIRSRKERDGLYFMQSGVDDFNGNYGSYYGANAVLGDEYK